MDTLADVPWDMLEINALKVNKIIMMSNNYFFFAPPPSLFLTVVDIMIPSFDRLSYLELGIAMDTDRTLLHITFNPTSTDGYLLYSGDPSATSDFLSLSLVTGRLVLEYDLGTGVGALVSDVLSQHSWHTALVTRELRAASMFVDGEQYGPVNSPGGNSHLNTRGALNIGGLRDYSILSPLANDEITGFTGCVTYFTVSERPVVAMPMLTPGNAVG